MTAPARLKSAVFFCAIACAAASASPQIQKPTFKSRLDLVVLDVSVMRGRAPVAGLSPADFVVLDNGQRQTLDGAAIEPVSIDLSLVIDLSGSTRGSLDDFKRDVADIATMLSRDDRIRLVTFGNDVREIVPMQATDQPLHLDELRTSGNTALIDAAFMALAWPSTPGRRHLVVMFTDAEDSWSTVPPDRLPAIALHSDALLHAVLVRPSAASLVWSPAPEVLRSSRQWLLRAVAATGGVSLQERRLATAFRRILDDFRTRYVLRYSPKGGATPGWHELGVQIARAGDFDVRARRGYFVDR